METMQIDKKKFDINLEFYLILKGFNSTTGLTMGQIEKTILLIHNSKDRETFITLFNSQILNKIKNENKLVTLKEILSLIDNELTFDIFVFSLYLLKFKPFLSEYAKTIDFEFILKDKDLLTLKRDQITKNKPYAYRVNGALISLVFFEFIENKDKKFLSEHTEISINKIFDLYDKLQKKGLEANQIFMIMFNESINQSIKSTAGSDLEESVEIKLANENIKSIKKIDSKNKEIEYDHFFEIDNRKYGISTKRTLRERYKQFKKIKNSKADIFIHITSGLDLNEAKAKTITSDDFGCYIFVFPEIYEKNNYMIENKKIFKTTDLTKKTLSNLFF